MKTKDPIPEWNTYYPSISEASAEQQEFYDKWERALEKGSPIDIGENLSYVFVYLYGLIENFLKSKRIDPLLAGFRRITDAYPEIEKFRQYVTFWTGDAYLYLREYDSAWPFIVQTSPDINKVINFRSKCSDTFIDGPALLSILKSDRGLTNFGKHHEVEIAQLASVLLSDFQAEHGSNLIQYFCQGYNFGNLNEADFEKLSQHFPDQKKFLMWKKIYETQERHKYPYRYSHILFSGAPVGFPRSIQCESVPYIITVAIQNELKRILRECENTVREENNLPKVGEGWISESELFHIIRRAFPDESILHHGRPAWLSPQHLDIYFPERNIGIEYQGDQHVVPADFFGGEEAFKKQRERDRRKKRLCAKNGCHLLYVYTDYDFYEVRSALENLIAGTRNA